MLIYGAVSACVARPWNKNNLVERSPLDGWDGKEKMNFEKRTHCFIFRNGQLRIALTWGDRIALSHIGSLGRYV